MVVLAVSLVVTPFSLVVPPVSLVALRQIVWTIVLFRTLIVDCGSPASKRDIPLSEARERPVAGRHAVDDVCQDRKIQYDHHEEHDPKRGLDALVAQQSLRKPCAGPAAKQFERMQRGFGRAPRTAFGGALVHRVGDKRDKAHDEIRRGYQHPWVSRIPGDDAVHGFTLPSVSAMKMMSENDCLNMAERSIPNSRPGGGREYEKVFGRGRRGAISFWGGAGRVLVLPM